MQFLGHFVFLNFIILNSIIIINSALTVLFLHSVLPDGPIITGVELTSLPLVKVVPDGQYTGPRLNTVVRMMRGLLEQKVPLQEFEVTICFEF